MRTYEKTFLIIIAFLLYVTAATYLFEYTINEVANTALSVSGIIVFIVLTYLLIKLILRIIKNKT